MEFCTTPDCTDTAAGGYELCERHLVGHALDVCEHMRLQLRPVEADDPDAPDEDILRTIVHRRLNE